MKFIGVTMAKNKNYYTASMNKIMFIFSELKELFGVVAQIKI